MLILGIETSCDETAAAVVKDGTKILSNVVVSQIDIHQEFGGVVPEVASRSHLEVILPVINKALYQAKIGWNDIDGIAVSNHPGLLGALLVGVLTARTLALVKQKPLYGINHVVAHTYANWLQKPPPQFPLLSLTVSGGHTQLMLFKDHFDYQILGKTQDDAVGEAFDKVAKMLGLLYPGGPAISQAAERGAAAAYSFPEAKVAGSYDFSFSGLKTAVLRHLQSLIGKDFSFPSTEIAARLTQQQINDTAASFEHAAVNALVKKTLAAFEQFQPNSVALAGGVAANAMLRKTLAEALPVRVHIPPIDLCTDNAAMVASLGYFAAIKKRAVSPFKLEAISTT